MSVRHQKVSSLSRALLLAIAAPLLACGGHATSEKSPPGEHFPDECREYFAAYAACMHALSPQHPDTANARVEAARASLALITDEALLRQSCSAGAAQLRSSCR